MQLTEADFISKMSPAEKNSFFFKHLINPWRSKLKTDIENYKPK